MKIWVDADACPKVIRETIVRAAERTGVECTFVANHLVPVPKRNNIHSIQVPSGFDIADDEIVKRTEPGDLVITSDIPLADEVITKGALALSSRGELYTKRPLKRVSTFVTLWILCVQAVSKRVDQAPFHKPTVVSSQTTSIAC